MFCHFALEMFTVCRPGQGRICNKGLDLIFAQCSSLVQLVAVYTLIGSSLGSKSARTRSLCSDFLALCIRSAEILSVVRNIGFIFEITGFINFYVEINGNGTL